jgi:hypothetical protein
VIIEQSGCAASRQGHVTCRRARRAVSLHLSIIYRKKNEHEQYVDTHIWSTRHHFPTVWDRHMSCLLYLKTLFCAFEPQSQGEGGSELINRQGRFPRYREFKHLTSELHFLSCKPRTARHFVWSANAVVPQSVLRGSQEIRNELPGNPWINFCNGYFEMSLSFNERNNVLLKIIAILLELAICWFRVINRTSN